MKAANAMTMMRLKRIKLLLAVEPAFRAYVTKSELCVQSKSGMVLQVTPFIIRVCRALGERGFDPHNCDRSQAIAVAWQIAHGEITVSAELSITMVATTIREKLLKRDPPIMQKSTDEILKSRKEFIQSEIADKRAKIQALQEDIAQFSAELVPLDLALRMMSTAGGVVAVEQALNKVTENTAAGVRSSRNGPLFKPYRSKNALDLAVVRARLERIMGGMLEGRAYNRSRFHEVWDCDRVSIYVREIAHAVPAGRPFLLANDTVAPEAGQVEAEEVVEALCSDWPSNLSVLRVADVRALALSRLGSAPQSLH